MSTPRHSDNVGRVNDAGSRHAAAVKLAHDHSAAAGRKLGSATSESKTAAAQKNGEEGGRPKGS